MLNIGIYKYLLHSSWFQMSSSQNSTEANEDGSGYFQGESELENGITNIEETNQEYIDLLWGEPNSSLISILSEETIDDDYDDSSTTTSRNEAKIEALMNTVKSYKDLVDKMEQLMKLQDERYNRLYSHFENLVYNQENIRLQIISRGVWESQYPIIILQMLNELEVAELTQRHQSIIRQYDNKNNQLQEELKKANTYIDLLQFVIEYGANYYNKNW